MALALEMGLDPEGDRAIREVWSRLEQLGVPSLEGHVPSIRPHLSLTVTDVADGLLEHAPGLALRGVEVVVEMAAVSLFPADPALLVMAGPPHCTLSMGVPAGLLDDTLNACLASPLPVRVHLRAAALTDSVTGATTPL